MTVSVLLFESDPFNVVVTYTNFYEILSTDYKLAIAVFLTLLVVQSGWPNLPTPEIEELEKGSVAPPPTPEPEPETQVEELPVVTPDDIPVGSQANSQDDSDMVVK